MDGPTLAGELVRPAGRVAYWDSFLDFVRANWAQVYPYHVTFPTSGQPYYRETHLDHVAWILYYELSRGERFDILEDAVAQGFVTADAISDYSHEAHCSEEDAFMNLLREEWPQLLADIFALLPADPAALPA